MATQILSEARSSSFGVGFHLFDLGGLGTKFAEIGFPFRISVTSLVMGMGLAVLMGVAGGVLPAFRAARMPITSWSSQDLVDRR